ncbi:MAG: HAMP domain-containing histidine kinase [Elusimicrobia bacterium]|nr:HAMP domain-containing histidine kinase [Elusimicrobiota bacterium]
MAPAFLRPVRAASRLTLRTRAALVVGLVGVSAFGGSVAYHIRRTADADLADSMAETVAFLANLPPLQDALRRSEQETLKYIISGNPAWREAREDAEAKVRLELEDLARAASASASARGSVAALRVFVTAALEEQDALEREFSAGRLSRSRAMKVASESKATDAAIRRIATLRELNYDGVARLVAEGHQASRDVFAIIILTGTVAVLLLMYALRVYLIGPIEALDAWARGWSPERPLGAPPLGASPEVAGLCESVTELARRAGEQVRQEAEMAKVKSQLVSTLSHEFNNALSVIQGVTVLLEETEGKETPEARERYYSMIKANLRSMSTEMRALIEMGRLEGGQFAVRPRRMDVGSVLRDSAERLGILSERRRQTVTVEGPAVPVQVRADPEALSLVATNLLSNAIKYTPDGGSIRVTVEPSGETVRVSVRDSGIGIAPSDHEKVFGGYYRTSAGQAQAKGFGVGLALARRIVEAHGSRLALESEPGKGSIFSFELPRWTEGMDG